MFPKNAWYVAATAADIDGKPLGRKLTGRIGLEMRMSIAGGERITAKIKHHQGDVFNHRPKLQALDWLRIVFAALFKQ